MMRADRLLSILMLLQAKGRMSAADLAGKLEVSERTIYRDMDALGAAGVPVTSEPGAQGGYALIDSYRTTLTGLTDGELQALFMLTVPAPLTELGVSRDLRAALRKLSASLPEVRRQDEERVHQRFYLDSTWWRQGGDPIPHLQSVHQAVWQDRKIRITFHLPFATEIVRLVSPYGLVAKAGVWYLVCAGNGRFRVYRVSDLLDVCLTDETFSRAADFDLVCFWQRWCRDRETSFSSFTAVLRIAPNLIPHLPRYFGHQIHTKIEQATTDADGCIQLELTFSSFFAARERILGFGRAVEVLAPYELRRSVRDFAEQIVDLYTKRGKPQVRSG